MQEKMLTKRGLRPVVGGMRERPNTPERKGGVRINGEDA